MSEELNLDLFGESGPESEEPDTSSSRPENARTAPPPDPRTEPPPPPEGPRVWSVSQVNRAVRGLLEGNVEPLWVGGEVGSWTRSRAGHCYFTLKDDRAQLRAVMFQREARTLPTDPEEGMQVRAYGHLTLYEARGDYQLVVRRVESEGTEGLWRLAFEKLRALLEGEGVLDPARKRPIPRFPTCVGVVTSPTGAALRDVVSVLRRRAPWLRVVVRGTRVQGEGAANEIADAVDVLSASGLADVLLVTRGGGSIEDLWAFNEEPVARAVARSPVPVISAVGHEVDVTICDLVADLRAPTPSAGAEAVAPDATTVLESLRRIPARLGRGLIAVSARRRERLEARSSRLTRAMELRLAPPKQSLDLVLGRLERVIRGLLDARARTLTASSARLAALSPLATLQRGYAVARRDDGSVIRSVRGFPTDAPFTLRVSDGTVSATLEGILDEEPP